MVKFKALGLALLTLLAGCSLNDQQIAEALQKNPEIIFKAIEEKPERFMQVINNVAKKAQDAEQQRRFSEMKQEREEQLKNPLKPTLLDERILSGSKDAKITIVEYADFQCPACRMAFNNLKPLKEKYGEQIKFFFKNMPLDFHPQAMPAALYFEGIAQQDKSKAKKYYELLFESQAQLKNESFLKEAAKKVGADLKRLSQDLKSESIKKTIESDMKEFESFGFTGTPVILVNGVALHGAQTAESIEEVIQQTTKESKTE